MTQRDADRRLGERLHDEVCYNDLLIFKIIGRERIRPV